MTANASLAERLEIIEAHIGINQLVARYAIGADRNNDPAILEPLFCDDATWEAPGTIERIAGRTAIAARLAELGQSFVLWSLHYMVAPAIDVSINRRSAECRWYLWELCTMRGEDGVARDTWLGGWYDATAEQTPDGWKFKSVCLDMRLVSPTESPWTGRASAPIAAAH